MVPVLLGGGGVRPVRPGLADKGALVKIVRLPDLDADKIQALLDAAYRDKLY